MRRGPLLDERQRKVQAGALAQALGRGGIATVSRAAGMSCLSGSTCTTSLTGGAQGDPQRMLDLAADAGGSNGCRLRLWKVELGRLAARTGLRITVCHCPPGTRECSWATWTEPFLWPGYPRGSGMSPSGDPLETSFVRTGTPQGATKRETTMRRLLCGVAVTAVLIVGVPGSASAAAIPGYAPLQPGAPIVDQSSDPFLPGAYCALNFVFTDKHETQVGDRRVRRTYIGTSPRCVTGVGQRVAAPGIGAFGTVVFSDGVATGSFALVEIDEGKLRYVSRVMRGYGEAPRGYTTSTTTKPGERLITHGYPYGASTWAAGVTRLGVLVDDDATRYRSAMQPDIQDRGSPVVTADGRAVGTSDEYLWTMWPPVAAYSGHQTIEGVLRRLARAGFDVTL